MAKEYIGGLPSINEIYDLIKNDNPEEAYSLAKIRFEATEKIYDYPSYVALRKRIFGFNDKEAIYLENEIIEKGNVKEISSLADTYKLLGLYNEAVDFLLKCLKEPYFNAVYIRLRDLLRFIGREEDIAELDNKFSNKGFDVNIKYLNIQVSKGIDGLVSNTEKLEELLKEYPDYLVVIDSLAANYVSLGKNEKAISLYEELYDRAETFERKCKILLFLANCKVNLGRDDEALNDLRIVQVDAIRNQPNLLNKYLSLMLTINKNLGRISIEIEYLKEICLNFPIAENYLALGNLYKRIDQIDNVLESFNMALESANTSYERCKVYLALLEVSMKLGDYDKASLYLRECTTDFDFYGEYENEISNCEALIKLKTGKKINDEDLYHYFVSQCREYSESQAIAHVRNHKEEAIHKEIHSMFDEKVGIYDLFYDVKEMIMTRKPTTFDASDIYELEMPNVVATIGGYPTKKVKVVTLMDTKQIITIYPIELSLREKRIYDKNKEKENEDSREIKCSKRSKMSQIDKFNQRLAQANKNSKK